ncbi:DUF2306 domain-containing protein [Kordiimonas aquimaris]|uniref:DUF2306 domain-containing protein n=1 Tax=Kordiimonas aquimaris TaxID=707591 RepID=UPI0021CF7587|nr:DUF2306 domain-containing protein [Kordiimonas aquimaris]
MNIDVFERLPIQITIHLFTAIAAFFLGAYQLMRKKGTRHHKQVGWVWMVLMVVVAVSAIFIQGFEGSSMPTLWGFSPIHLFVVLTLYNVPKSIIEIRRGDVAAHASSVRGLYMGGMVIAGAIAMMPGRLMWHIMFGD